ncbi:MAG: hypothetical protein AAF456_01270 [Planctomycetota bacterium]
MKRAQNQIPALSPTTHALGRSNLRAPGFESILANQLVVRLNSILAISLVLVVVLLVIIVLALIIPESGMRML